MISQKKIWILEDDKLIAENYSMILSHRYALDFFTNIHDFRFALNGIKTEGDYPSAIVADLRTADGSLMEDLEGGKIILPKGVPLLIASGMDDKKTIEACYRCGANDYLVKPFSIAEFVAKLERLIYPVEGNFRIDLETLRVQRKEGCSEALSAKEVQILSVLAKTEGKTVSRDEFRQKIWTNISVTNKVLDVHISNLRKKLRPLGVSIEFVHPNSFQLEGTGLPMKIMKLTGRYPSGS